MNTKKVWLVTGASKGLGLILVKKLLASDFRVIATSRDLNSLTSELGEKSESFLPLELTLTDDSQVKQALAEGISHFGGIDVVVNNAGYGQIGTLEELSYDEVRNSFEVNVFGSINVIRHAMPYLRQQESGHIFNIASVGGFSGAYPGWGVYCGTKFAVAGFTESLAEEVRPFGIYATVVYPGYFRTDFLSKGSVKTAAQPISAYAAARQSEQIHLDEINGRQPNDPEKAADILITVSQLDHPPVHLFLGKDAYQLAHQKIELIEQQLKAHEELATSTEIIEA